MSGIDFKKGRAWIELDIERLRHNVEVLRSLLPQGCCLMPALKANAYGHGAVSIARELNTLGVHAFCVASVDEAVELREHGVEGEILILGYTHPQQAELLQRYDLTQTVVDREHAAELNALGQTLNVHIAVDTGMHRLGERCEDFERILEIFQMQNLSVKAVFTHLCTADSEDLEHRAFALRQLSSFRTVLRQLRQRGYSPKAHILGSYGLLNYPEFGGDYARVGIALYGVLSCRDDLTGCPVKLLPVLSLKARVALVKQVYPGEGAGYGLDYVADREKQIAVVSIGYADGIPRSLSCGHGKALINGFEAPIIGRICMDQMLVDVSDVPDAKSGDAAILIGASGDKEITAYDLAEAAGTITNEVLSRLGERLKRTCKLTK